ncbi:MAG: TonB-dependent receptor [Cyclobacteriaceae bacterium]
MKKAFFAYLMFCGINCFAQLSIEGSVKDAYTYQPLVSCSIFSTKTKQGTVTDSYGKFKIAIASNDQLIFSYIGYQSDTINVSGETNCEILLKPIPTALEEVIVTGTMHTSSIKENPISISNITPKMIERANENNIIDVLAKNTPGLNVLKTGPNISKPFIRGLGYFRVLTLYDGVRQEGQQWGDEHGIEADNYGIDKAEVVKGPASLIYGSDALAGVVSLLPYIPKNSDGKIDGRWLSEYQSNNGLVGNGFRIGYGDKHWLWAARGSVRLAKNYSNKVDGRVYNTGFQEKNLSALLGYKSVTGFSHLNLTLYDNLQGIPDGSRDSLSRKFTKQVYEGIQDNVKNRPVVSDTELNSYTLSPLHQRIQHYRVYTNNHYQIGKGDVSLLLAASQNIRREYDHPTDPQQAGMYVRLNTFNYSLRYKLLWSSKVESSLGITGMWQNNKVKDATDFPIPDFSLRDFGASFTSQWKSTKWVISGGIRVDERSLRIPDFFVAKNPTTGFFKHVSLPDTANATLQFKNLAKSFYGVSASMGATFQWTEHISLKANIARGYRAPNIAEIASNGLDPGAHIHYLGNRNFIPEFNWQEDIGVFVNFHSLNSSVSFFNNNIQNYIYLNQKTDAVGKPITDAQGNKTIQYQQASAQLYGLEVSLNLKPGFFSGLSFNNQVALCYGFNRNNDFENKKQQGEYLPFIPPARLISNLNQDFKLKSKLISSINAFAEADFNAAQNRYLGLFNTETKTAGYTLINIGARVSFLQSKKYSLQFQLQVNNLFDTVYQSNMSRLKYFEYYSLTPNGRYGIYGMGRNICSKIIFSF